MGATKPVAKLPPSDVLTRVRDGDIRKNSPSRSTTIAEKSTSAIIIDLTEEASNSASSQPQDIDVSLPVPDSSTSVKANAATKADAQTVANPPIQRSPVPPQPLVNATGNAVLAWTNNFERETVYVVIRYNSTLYGEAEDVLGTFLTVEEANQAVLTSLDDIDEGEVEWEEFEQRTYSNGTISLSTAAEVNGDPETYTTQVFIRERKIHEPAPSIVYVVRDERRQYACRAPDDELVGVEILDVFKVKKWQIGL